MLPKRSGLRYETLFRALSTTPKSSSQLGKVLRREVRSCISPAPSRRNVAMKDVIVTIDGIGAQANYMSDQEYTTTPEWRTDRSPP